MGLDFWMGLVKRRHYIRGRLKFATSCTFMPAGTTMDSGGAYVDFH
jgi:hypothetical protein